MRLLVQILRALCIALLLPAAVMAATQTDHVPTRHDCCERTTSASHYGDNTPETADPARGDHDDRSHEPLHASCGFHACNWIEGGELVAGRPHGLIQTLYAPSAGMCPPAAPVESPHRPPAVFS